MRFEQHRSKFAQPFAMLAIVLAGVQFSSTDGKAQDISNVMLKANSFQIPFNVGTTGAAPVEVQLYVAQPITEKRSPDSIRGASRDGDLGPGKWRLLDRQPPGAGLFQVSKTEDGTFWFATRTIDSAGRPHPPGPIQPELKVVVDTEPPRVDLIADSDGDGKVQASFTIKDATPTKELTVHYVTDTKRQWETAVVVPTADGGRFAFQPDDQWKQLSLRLRVLDGAGNETIIRKLVQRPRVAASGTTRFASGPPTLPGNYFSGMSGLFHDPSKTQPGKASQSGRFPAGQPETIPLPPPSSPEEISADFGRNASQSGSLTAPSHSFGPTSNQQTVEAKQPVNSRPRTPAEAMRPLDSQSSSGVLAPPANGSMAVPNRSTPSINPSDRSSDGSPTPQTPFHVESIPTPVGSAPTGQLNDQPSEHSPAQLNTPQQNSASLITPAGQYPSTWSTLPERPQRPNVRKPSGEFRRTNETATQSSRRPPIADLARLSERALVRHSDSNQFSLDFEIEAIGGRGVDKIELYGTVDGGDTWKRWGEDPDKASPFDIETNGEGIFGFNIVVVASNGLASPRPLGGDTPDIVVVVDQTKPDVSITGAQYGEGDRAGSLVIRYRCEDDYLMQRPITLAFSDSPKGPWTTIAAGLRNMGDYVWPADPQQ